MKSKNTKTFSRRTSLIEGLESRQLLAWSSYAQLIGQDQLATKFAGLTGSGQTVALIDTGIDYNNPSLGGGFGAGKKVIGGYDFVDNDSDPMDTDGHGTETAGFVAANEFTYNGTTYSGIAPDAKLVALRVGSGNSGIADSKIEQGLQWVIDNYKRYGITVVNISLGGGSYPGDYTGSQLVDEFQKLHDLNIFVVAASGNEGDSAFGTAGVAYPAADPNVFAAGAITSADQISSFTQRGNELDLLAPGEGVVSTKKGGGYATIDGTSFSSPIVAGAVALLRQAASALRVDDLGSVLRTSSAAEFDGDGDAGRTTARYYARLNLIDAITLAKVRGKSNLDSLLSSRSTAVDSAVDPEGVIHLAYYDASTKRILYSTRQSDGSWSAPLVVERSGDDVGQQLSIAIDQAGRPAIAYFDATTADLKYAYFNGNKWLNNTLDSKNSTGQYPSLAFDSDGDATIAYYKKSGGDLKLITYDRTTTKWTTSVLDSGGTADADVGQYASLAYYSDSSGYSLAVAYADRTNGDLKYTRFASGIGGGWVTEVVDDLNGVANVNLSLDVVDGRAAAHIAYQDTKNADVKFGYKATSWYTLTIAGKGTVGRNVSSYVDADGNYHVVYYDTTKAATYDATTIAPVISATGTLTNAASVSGTSRVGTIGQLATVVADDSGLATLIGLNKPGKSIGAWALIANA